MTTTGPLNSIAAGIACGAGAALFWAAGFTAAKHGIDIGLSPADLSFHRFFWSGVILLPLLMRERLSDLGGLGWGRAIALTILGGPGLALISYSGFLLVPLGHGGVIQPSCAAVGGLALAALVLKEKLPLSRIVGAGVIVCGLFVIGGEAITTIGLHGVAGDLMFMVAGFFFATFGILLRLWRLAPTRAMVIVSIVSLGFIPVYWALHGFETMLALGWRENLLQAVMQGILAGPGAIYLFTRSVVILGAARAAVYPSLVPGFTLLIGFLALGIVPSVFQFLGFAIVLAGFRLTQKG
jgi:drug/metabolite transporter (DMT)-like permease